MTDFLRKGMLMGFGLMSLTREKAEEFMEELVKRGELSEKEGREAVEELVEKSREMKKDLTARIEKTVEEVVGKMNLATKDDLEVLKKRISALEKAIKDGK